MVTLHKHFQVLFDRYSFSATDRGAGIEKKIVVRRILEKCSDRTWYFKFCWPCISI